MFGVMFLIVSQVPNIDLRYFPYSNRIEAIHSHYRHVSPLDGRTFLSLSPVEEHYDKRAWNSLTMAEKSRPEYAGLFDAEFDTTTGVPIPRLPPRLNNPTVHVRVYSHGTRLVAGTLSDELLFDFIMSGWH